MSFQVRELGPREARLELKGLPSPAALQDVARVQAMSRRQGHIYHAKSPISVARNAALRLIPSSWLMAGYDWLYGWSSE